MSGSSGVVRSRWPPRSARGAVEQPGLGLEVGAGGGRQGGRLEQRRLDDRVTEGLGGAVDGPVGADHTGQRRAARRRRRPAGGAGGGLGEPEAQQPGVSVSVDQQVGQAQIPVGDTGARSRPTSAQTAASSRSSTCAGGRRSRVWPATWPWTSSMCPSPVGAAVSTGGVRTPARVASSDREASCSTACLALANGSRPRPPRRWPSATAWRAGRRRAAPGRPP